MRFQAAHSLALFAIGLIGVTDTAAVVDPPQEPRPKSVKGRFEDLSRKYDEQKGEYLRAVEQADTEEAQQRVVKALYPDDHAYAKQYLALAREEPAGPIAAEALYATVRLGGFSVEAKSAIEVLGHDFSADAKMRGLIQQIALSPCVDVEFLLRDVLAKNPDHAARGLACQGLANLLDGYANLPRLHSQDPKMARTLERVVGKENLDRIARRDAGTMIREAEALHERVLAEFRDVRLYPEFPDDKQTIGKASEIWLSARREMAIGRSAPPIEGKDVGGKPLKLRDYRGKVVVVVFWASWCGPCMAQIPHERALAERLRDKPFALLGVNCDLSQEEARAVIAKTGITWPNWYDGDPNEGPIVASWHARALPQVYVLDADGMIRFKDVRGEALDKAVDELLAVKPSAR